MWTQKKTATFIGRVLSTTFLLASANAWGSPAPSKQQLPSSKTLFDEGLEQMLAGNYQNACPKLESSHRLQPRVGTLFTLAECYAKWGLKQKALVHYQRYLSALVALDGPERALQGDRIAIAHAQVRAFRGAASTQTTKASSPEPKPGPLAPKYKAHTELRAFNEVTSFPGDSPLRPWVYGVGGVGVTGLLVGGVSGGVAMSAKNTVDEECNGLQCSHEGKGAADRAQTFAGLSTASFTVGALAATTALVMFFLDEDSRVAPRTGELESVSVKPCPGGACLGTQW